jgi:hypothetical protein
MWARPERDMVDTGCESDLELVAADGVRDRDRAGERRGAESVDSDGWN